MAGIVPTISSIDDMLLGYWDVKLIEDGNVNPKFNISWIGYIMDLDFFRPVNPEFNISRIYYIMAFELFISDQDTLNSGLGHLNVHFSLYLTYPITM